MKVKSIMKMYFLVFMEQLALELNAVSAKNGKGKHILKRVNRGPNGRLAASVCARTGRTPGGRTANGLVYAAGQLLECVWILIRELKIVQYGVKARSAGIIANRAAARIPVDSTWHPAGQRAGMRVTAQQLDKRPRRLQIHTSLHTLYIFEDHVPHVRPGQAAVLQHALASPPVAATNSKNAIGNTILSNAQSALPRPPGNRPDGILVSLALVSVSITVQFKRLACP